MNVLTVPAHLATLAVHGIVTVAVVDALPTRPEWMTQIDRSEWWLCDRCKFSMMSPATHPAPVCPSCGRVPLDLTGQRIGLRADTEGHPFDGHDWGNPDIAYTVWIDAHDGQGRREFNLHPGCIVGSAVIEAVVPIVRSGEEGAIRTINVDDNGSLWLVEPQTDEEAEEGPPEWREVTHWLDFGQDFTPGKLALILTDAKSCEQRCPACWGSGTTGTLLALCGHVEDYAPDDTCVMRAGHSGPHYHESDVASDWAPAIAEHCPTCLNWSCGTCPPIPFATDETWSAL